MANSQVSERMSDDAGKPGLQKTFARTSEVENVLLSHTL